MQVGDARRTLQTLQEKLRAQQLTQQKVYNLTRACDDEQYRLRQMEQQNGHLDVASVNNWEMEAEAVLNGGSAPSSMPNTQTTSTPTGTPPVSNGPPAQNLPSAAVLRARINAVRNCTDRTRQVVGVLQARSKERELKYRRLVSLCTHTHEQDLDQLLDTLTRAVESEKGELEIVRVKRFLDGVEAVVQ